MTINNRIKLASAALIALAIILAPIFWQNYKMNQCVDTLDKVNDYESKYNAVTCITHVNG